MKKTAQSKKAGHKRAIPKNIEIISALISYLDSSMDEGEDIAITPLSEKVEVKNNHIHVNTARDKLTEGFIMRDILTEFEPTYEDGILVRIKKKKKQRFDIDEISQSLIEMKKELSKINEKLKKDAI